MGTAVGLPLVLLPIEAVWPIYGKRSSVYIKVFIIYWLSSKIQDIIKTNTIEGAKDVFFVAI